MLYGFWILLFNPDLAPDPTPSEKLEVFPILHLQMPSGQETLPIYHHVFLRADTEKTDI